MILYTPGYGSLTTPAGGSRYEVRIRLDQAGPLVPNVPRTGTVVGTKSGGGMTIGAGHWVLTGVGASGPTLVSEYPLGEKVTIAAGVSPLPQDATDAIGGGPALVRGGVADPRRGRGLHRVADRLAHVAVRGRPDRRRHHHVRDRRGAVAGPAGHDRGRPGRADEVPRTPARRWRWTPAAAPSSRCATTW